MRYDFFSKTSQMPNAFRDGALHVFASEEMESFPRNDSVFHIQLGRILQIVQNIDYYAQPR